MKITKSQLENIIREELALVKEKDDPWKDAPWYHLDPDDDEDSVALMKYSTNAKTRAEYEAIQDKRFAKQPEEAGDPIGPVEAQKMAELLKNLGFTLTRGGLNSFIEFLEGLESRGDLNATPDTRRGAMAEASSLDAGPEYLTQRAKDADLPSGGDPVKQEYDALTTMISRLDGMESFLLNTTRQASDEALTQQAAEQLNALHATLSQLRKGL